MAGVEINTKFVTVQDDLFTSGIAAKIGMNSLGIWLAIKKHADYNTGECWPGLRRISTLTGLSIDTVRKGIDILIDAKLLRIIEAGSGTRSTRYIARERLDVSLGDRTLCTIVVDYIPSRIKHQLTDIETALKKGESRPDAFAECEIIPGDGFIWDSASNVLRASINHDSLQIDHEADTEPSLLERRVKTIQQNARKRRKLSTGE
jgi:hypothetical protein